MDIQTPYLNDGLYNREYIYNFINQTIKIDNKKN